MRGMRLLTGLILRKAQHYSYTTTTLLKNAEDALAKISLPMRTSPNFTTF